VRPATLRLGAETIHYVVKKAKGKKIRLTIADTGVLVIENTNGRLDAATQEFIAQKKQWLLRHIKRRQSTYHNAHDLRSRLHEVVPVLGREIPLYYQPSPNRSTSYKIDANRMVINAPETDWQQNRMGIIGAALRHYAEGYLKYRTIELAAATGHTLNRITVKGHKSKWGSCSTARNINLNWRLIFMAADVIDYVIIHELMHLLEMNHSPRFWAHVCQHSPHYKKHIQTLREKQWMINLYA
jgi:predicted metal-dependent hydrolase